MNYDSLTSPEDYANTEEKDKKPGYDIPPLTRDETNLAMKNLYVNKYPNVDRAYIDNIPHQKKYCLCSFLPSKKAKPDSVGMYGMIKFRGTFDTIDDAEVAAEYIIRTQDSKHVIHVCETGKPFPMISDNVNCADETVRIDLQQKINKEVRDAKRKQKQEEHLEKQQMLDRQKKLLEESKEDAPPEPFDAYTTLQVKRAQLIWSYKETEAKQGDIKNALKNTLVEIKAMDDESGEYKKEYKERYMSARREAGIPENMDDDGFVKFMMDDIEIPFLQN